GNAAGIDLHLGEAGDIAHLNDIDPFAVEDPLDIDVTFERLGDLPDQIHHLLGHFDGYLGSLWYGNPFTPFIDPTVGRTPTLHQRFARPFDRFDHDLIRAGDRVFAEGHAREYRRHHFLNNDGHLQF